MRKKIKRRVRSNGNRIEERQRMKVEERKEGKQKTKKEIEAGKNQMVNKESQRRKVEEKEGSKKVIYDIANRPRNGYKTYCPFSLKKYQ